MKQSGQLNIKVKLGILLILVLCVVRFAAVPANNYIKQEKLEISMLKQSIAKKKSYLTNRGKIEKQLAKLNHIYDAASEMFWKKFKDPAALMLNIQKKLEKNAEKRDLDITSANWGTPTGKEIIKAPVQLHLSGLPQNVFKYIKKIEVADKFYSIDTLRFICRSRNPEMQVKMTVSAYGISLRADI